MISVKGSLGSITSKTRTCKVCEWSLFWFHLYYVDVLIYSTFSTTIHNVCLLISIGSQLGCDGLKEKRTYENWWIKYREKRKKKEQNKARNNKEQVSLDQESLVHNIPTHAQALRIKSLLLLQNFCLFFALICSHVFSLAVSPSWMEQSMRRSDPALILSNCISTI